MERETRNWQRITIDLIEIIQSQAREIKNLLRQKKLVAVSLTAVYSLDSSIINKNKKSSMSPQTIDVPIGLDVVSGQITPLAADGVTVLPISSIEAGSEEYSSSDDTIATVAADPSGVEGAYKVTRVPGASGDVTITYDAMNADAQLISGSDDFTFDGASSAGVAESLTSVYQPPVAAGAPVSTAARARQATARAPFARPAAARPLARTKQ